MVQTLVFSTKILSLGQHISIKKTTENTEYKSIIEEINDAFIKIMFPASQGFFMYPHITDTYCITVHCETGIFKFDCHYISHVTDPIGMIKVSTPKEMIKIQKRENVRINDLIQFTIQPKDSDDKFDGYTKNISAGGMLIITHHKMNLGDEFKINFRLFIDEYVEMGLKGIVVKLAEPDMKTQKSYYGIKFLEVDEKQKYQLIRYVFKRQAQIIKLQKEI
jgi:c-di-GMP-binding flagellar brake protein YcgR